ncbi:MAG: hypothetical protein AB1668_04370 [Nanoarchaeota archaeon]
MEEITTPYGIIDLAEDWKGFYRRELRQKWGEIISRERPPLDDYVTSLLGAYLLVAEMQISIGSGGSGAQIRSQRMRMLLADGDCADFFPEMVSCDGYDKVREWVRIHDGCYGALVVKAFNPQGVHLQTNSSYLLYSTNARRPREMNLRDVLNQVACHDIAQPPRVCRHQSYPPPPQSCVSDSSVVSDSPVERILAGEA